SLSTHGGCPAGPDKARVRAGREAEAAMHCCPCGLGVNGHVSRVRGLLLTGDEFDRREEARRPTGREQLLGVGAGTPAAGRRKLDVEPAIVAVGGAALPTTRGARFRGVQEFFEGHYDFRNSSRSALIWSAPSGKGRTERGRSCRIQHSFI